MKAVLNFLFILVLGASALANTSTTVNNLNPKIESYEQVTTLKMDILLDSGLVVATDVNEVKNANEKSIAFIQIQEFKNKEGLDFHNKKKQGQNVLIIN